MTDTLSPTVSNDKRDNVVAKNDTLPNNTYNHLLHLVENRSTNPLFRDTPCYNTADDFYYQVTPFGSYDVKILVERANDYNICTTDIIEHCFNSWSKEQIFGDEIGATMNFFFESLYILRIEQLKEYTQEAIEDIVYILNNDFSISDGSDDTKEYKQTDLLLSNLQRLLKYLEEQAIEKIHLNCCCSCFDCHILDDDLDSVHSKKGLILAMEKINTDELPELENKE